MDARPFAARSSLGDRLALSARRCLGAILLAMVALNFAGVASRYLRGAAIYGADEVLVYAMVWLVFLGAAVAAVRNQHLGFPGGLQALPANLRRVLSRLIDLTGALILGYVSLQSWQVLVKLDRIGQTSMAAGIPMTVPHAAVFVSFTAIAAALAIRALAPAGFLDKTPPLSR